MYWLTEVSEAAHVEHARSVGVARADPAQVSAAASAEAYQVSRNVCEFAMLAADPFRLSEPPAMAFVGQPAQASAEARAARQRTDLALQERRTVGSGVDDRGCVPE